MKIIVTQSGKVDIYDGSEPTEPSLILNEEAAHELIVNANKITLVNQELYDTFDIEIERYKLLKNISEVFDVTIEDILKRKRYRKYIYPRHLYITMILTKSSMSTTSVGNVVGYNHATVLHAAKNTNNLLLDKEYGPKIRKIMAIYGVSKLYHTSKKIKISKNDTNYNKS